MGQVGKIGEYKGGGVPPKHVYVVSGFGAFWPVVLFFILEYNYS